VAVGLAILSMACGSAGRDRTSVLARLGRPSWPPARTSRTADIFVGSPSRPHKAHRPGHPPSPPAHPTPGQSPPHPKPASTRPPKPACSRPPQGLTARPALRAPAWPASAGTLTPRPTPERLFCARSNGDADGLLTAQLGGSLRGSVKTEITVRDGLHRRLGPQLAEFAARERPRGAPRRRSCRADAAHHGEDPAGPTTLDPVGGR
jgi:hypothetical protein